MAPTNKPRVVLGLLTFGPPGSEYHGSRVTDINKFAECLDHFQERGYNEVDTARTYVGGLQESFTKEAKWQERGLSLATKWYPQKPGDNTKANIKKNLEKSLAELGTQQVDLFYLHAPDRSVPFEETLEACNELHQAQKFKRLGISNYAAWEVAEICTICRQRGWIQPTVYQAMYNSLTRAIEEELVPCCRKFGINIIAYNPLAGGVLSGKYKSKEAPTDGRFSDIDPKIGKQYRERYLKDSNFVALQMVEPIAKEYGLTLPQVAFRWCVHHSKLDMEAGDGIVIGVSSIEQLRVNLDCLEEGPLPDAVVKALDEAWVKVTKAECPLYWR
ncbi:Aflatoxin B1 aldehyde reductase member 2 [Pseudocercospora fuligena]|uniref:Aflatoxin B1 aldehyde reductase member 2 n=1 Tax=Pseudocercospora fuligena TaxID=685502 RepID=A0A8H6RGN7_9PEZI|nr:Aflatoxin B1 aldehyde reductase member 2 [Pseudocercospora fuligena]